MRGFWPMTSAAAYPVMAVKAGLTRMMVPSLSVISMASSELAKTVSASCSSAS
jgi:hypothetical protein